VFCARCCSHCSPCRCSPLTFHFQPGTHNIEVRRAGSEPWRRELTVYAYNPASVVAILLPEKKEK
jgi:hypothetical protein